MPQLEKTVIDIAHVARHEICVAAEDGDRVFESIRSELKNNRAVELNFEGVRRLTASFLTAALGPLYTEFADDEIREWVTITGVSDEDRRLIDEVSHVAKRYASDPAKFKQAQSEIIGSDS